MYIYRRITLLAISIVALVGSAYSQDLIYNVDFDTYFDNREYSTTESLKFRSGTDFAAALAPSLGLRFSEEHTLNFGVQTFTKFDELDNKLFDSIETILYYGYDSQNWSAAAGLFPRSRMEVGSYSTAFFADDYLFYDRLIGGLMGQYRVDDSFVELVCDWESQPSESSRERFRLLTAGRKYWSTFYAGYNLSVTHFAGADNDILFNVVDNALINPRIGARFSGTYDFDISLSYLQSMQRDRAYENEWLTPAMGEVAFTLSRWGVTLSEQFYFGDNLFPLYDGHTLDDGTVMEYGSLLYTGDPYFSTEGGFYNRAAVGYSRSFFDGQLTVRAQFVTHADSCGLGTEQIVDVAVKIGGKLYSAKK